MAYAKLAPLAVFLLATFSMFPIMKAAPCDGTCYVWDLWGDQPLCGLGHTDGCYCNFGLLPLVGRCSRSLQSIDDDMVEAAPNLCNSHADCAKKGSGSFCARYPNSGINYGWCFASNSEAENYIKTISKNKFKEDFLKLPNASA